VKRRVLCAPHTDSCLGVNSILVSELCFMWYEKSAPSAAARPRRATCLVVVTSGV
jgi:hypothetical protein